MSSGKGIVRRKVWTAVGTLFVVLGAIGALLPVMPSTPFLLLAAGCYARGSPRAYRWLIGNRLFGEHLRRYSEGKGLTVTAKAGSISAVVAGTSLSAVMTGLTPLLTLLLVIVAGAVTIHLLSLPTCRRV